MTFNLINNPIEVTRVHFIKCIDSKILFNIYKWKIVIIYLLSENNKKTFVGQFHSYVDFNYLRQLNKFVDMTKLYNLIMVPFILIQCWAHFGGLSQCTMEN